MAKRTPVSVNMSVLNFLEHLPEIHRKDAKIMMYDTEPVAIGMGRTVPFDIGYRDFTLGGYRGKDGGGLVYEVIRNREDMTHIQRYGKIKNATAGELYHVINLLRDEVNPANGELGWFASDVELSPLYGIKTREEVELLLMTEIQNSWGDTLPITVMPASGLSNKELYNKMVEIHKKSRDAVDFFTQQKEQLSTTAARERLAVDRTLNLEQVLALYINHEMRTQELIDYFENSNNEIHASSVSTVQKIRAIREHNRKLIMKEERYTGYDEATDMKRLQTVPGGENIKPLRKILAKYESDFKDGAIGIMGHNINKDLEWTTNIIKMVPSAQQYAYLFDPDQINSFCTLAIMRRLYTLEGTELLQTMLSANSENLAEIYKEALPSMPGLGDGKGFKLEVLCQAIMGMQDDQKHTALADVDLTIDLFEKVAHDFARGELSERK